MGYTMHLTIRSIPVIILLFKPTKIIYIIIFVSGLTERWLKSSIVSVMNIHSVDGCNYMDTTPLNVWLLECRCSFHRRLCTDELCCMDIEHINCMFVDQNTNDSSFVVVAGRTSKSVLKFCENNKEITNRENRFNNPAPRLTAFCWVIFCD